jgi:hypothetical protein
MCNGRKNTFNIRKIPWLQENYLGCKKNTLAVRKIP